MRILYHHRTQSGDAQGVHISEMVKAFRELGHDVEVAALIRGDEQGRRVGGAFWGSLKRWQPRWMFELMCLGYNALGYLRLARSIRANRPDFIYERYALNTFCGVLAGKRFGIPLILEVNAPLYHEEIAHGHLSFRRLTRFLERWICSNSARTITVTHVMKEMLVEEGVPADKVRVLENGVDPGRFHPGVSGDAIRRRHGLTDRTVVGFVGWFRPWHGLEMLLEIMAEAQLAERGIRLLLVGDGPSYASLMEYARSGNLESSVVFTGPVDREEVAAHVAAMDIAVQPSATEYACPMKLVEYMAMAKCIIAPDQPNIRELLRDRINGILFRPGDKESFRKALLEVLEDRALAVSMGKKAHETVRERGLFWSIIAGKSVDFVSGTAPADASSDIREPKIREAINLKR